MKNIMLVCSAGMSTSMLVTRMQKAADEQGVSANIFATSASEADKHLANESIDVVLLGPQVKYMLNQFKDKLAPKSIPVDVINMQDYGMMRGDNVLNFALEKMKEEN